MTILYCPKQSYVIPSNPVLSRAILCYLEQSSTILRNSVISQAILSYHEQSYAILCNPEKSCPILSNPLCYPKLSCLIPVSIPIQARHIYILVSRCVDYTSVTDATDRPTGIVTTREALASKKLMACSILL